MEQAEAREWQEEAAHHRDQEVREASTEPHLYLLLYLILLSQFLHHGGSSQVEAYTSKSRGSPKTLSMKNGLPYLSKDLFWENRG